MIDTATNTVVVAIPVGGNPEDIEMTPDGTRAFVTSRGNATVSVIDIATNTVIAAVAGFSTPNGVAVSPNGTRVYVTNGGTCTVSVITYS